MDYVNHHATETSSNNCLFIGIIAVRSFDRMIHHNYLHQKLDADYSLLQEKCRQSSILLHLSVPNSDIPLPENV